MDPSASACEPFRQVILDKLEQGLSRKRIWQDLVVEHDFTARYHSVKRFVRKLNRSTPLPFRRIEVERAALLPLPAERFPNFCEAQRSVHLDGYVQIAHSYYSVPPEYVGRTVWVRWDQRTVRVFNHRFEQIALHARRDDDDRFNTLDRHIAKEKRSGIERGVTWWLGRASLIGPQADRWAQQMLLERGIEGVRVLQGLLHLAKRHPAQAIDRACQVASSRGLYRLRAIREAIAADVGEQEQFEFIEQHPIIRDLTEYGLLVRAAFGQAPLPAPQEQAL